MIPWTGCVVRGVGVVFGVFGGVCGEGFLRPAPRAGQGGRSHDPLQAGGGCSQVSSKELHPRPERAGLEHGSRYYVAPHEIGMLSY
jgi:hypothetical protein